MAGNKTAVSVITDDRFLFQKIRLELWGEAECRLCKNRNEANGADILLIDADYLPESDCNAITLSRNGRADVAIPFPIGALKSRITGRADAKLSLNEKESTVKLGGRNIRLTEVEYSLLSALMKRGAEFTTREELLSEVWGDGAEKGVINVYIHYLREKLESGGERIILSSRGSGYRINGLYLEESK